MKKKIVFLPFFLLPLFVNPHLPFHVPGYWINIEYYNEYPKGSINRHNLDSVSDEYLLAMVAIHECINICPQDAPYIIEATWNRVANNWGNYGDLKKQLKSSEFRGLLDSNFYFDPSNIKHCLALKQARDVIKGKRKCEYFIVGWLTHYDSDTIHVNKAMKKVIATPTWHKFWTK